MPVEIENYLIGDSSPPFIVAEMSANHGGSLERALMLVDAAADAGAHGFKLQTYTADTMTLDVDEKAFYINNPENPWHGRSLYNLYLEAATPWAWHKRIFEKCRQRNIIPFSSPFDASAVDFLEDLEVPCYKIAGFENADLPLIRKVASTGKPMLISTGMATLSELDETIHTARDAGCNEIILLKCTSTYPASPKDSNLRTIPHLRKMFDVEVGLSDHTLGIGVSIASVSFGATVIEKHFTLPGDSNTVDSSFSIAPSELKQLVDETKRAWESLGKISYGPTAGEKGSLGYRRSLYAVKDILAGEPLTGENVRAIRPAGGLPPRYMQVVVGKKASVEIKKGTPISWTHLCEQENES